MTPGRTEESLLRHVALGTSGYTLTTWDVTTVQPHGRSLLAYVLTSPDGSALFDAADFGVSPYSVVDSDETLRSLLSFLLTRPGDTDAEYFDAYTPAQLAFATTHDLDADDVPLVDIEDIEGDA